MVAKVIEIGVPEYTIDRKPDYLSIGKKVDDYIGESFPDGTYAIRAIGSKDHPNLTVDELIQKILDLGTDRYDPGRKSVAHEQFAVYDYDFHAGVSEIKNSKITPDKADDLPTMFGSTIKDFYENAPIDRGYPVRIDLLLLYDINKLEKAKKVDSESVGVSAALEEFLFRFKDRNNKKDALVGIVRLLD